MSRWTCTQPLGTPVEPEVYAIIATSSRSVSAAVNRSGRPLVNESSVVSPERASPATKSCVSPGACSGARVLDDVGELARPQHRHGADGDHAELLAGEPGHDELGHVRQAQQQSIA